MYIYIYTYTYIYISLSNTCASGSNVRSSIRGSRTIVPDFVDVMNLRMTCGHRGCGTSRMWTKRTGGTSTVWNIEDPMGLWI